MSKHQKPTTITRHHTRQLASNLVRALRAYFHGDGTWFSIHPEGNHFKVTITKPLKYGVTRSLILNTFLEGNAAYPMHD